MAKGKEDTPSGTAGQQPLTPEELLTKLRVALSRDGDFPASAKIVSELRQLTSDPKTTANQVTEVILREPSLGTRVLHLVNSAFYRRTKPIMTVSQAVIQIGMKPLAELCAGLILLQKFVPAARRGGTFANCLRKTVVTSLLSSAFSSQCPAPNRSSKNEEFGYLAGSFAELGTLLLAYYFPQVYEAALRRSEQKKVTFGKALFEITGLSPEKLSTEVIDALKLPSFYHEVISPSPGAISADSANIAHLSKIVHGASEVSGALTMGKDKSAADAALADLQRSLNMPAETMFKIVGDLPKLFKDHCTSIDLQLPSLPEFVATFADQSSHEQGSAPSSGGAEASPASSAGKPKSDQKADTAPISGLQHYINEIRQSVESREPTASVITSAMETLAFGLKFDRVLLLLVTNNRSRLSGRLLLGSVPNFDPKKLSRPIGDDAPGDAPDARALREARPIFTGTAILENGWPIVALPIGYDLRGIGVLYADRCQQSTGGTSSSKAELSPQEQAAVGMIAELLDRSLSSQ